MRLLLALGALLSFSVEAGEYPVSLTGYGPVHLGMTVAELEQALQTPLNVQAPELEGCTYAEPGQGHEGLALMLKDGQLVRIDILGPGIRTLSGATVGSSESEIAALYSGRLQRSPHAYGAGSYFTLLSENGRYGLRFETAAGKVTSFYVGLKSAIQLAEGCS
jgi:hypothetical protein